jgi:hypothetical protein
LRSWRRLENEETALGSNKETDQEERAQGGSHLALTPFRAGASTASKPATRTNPEAEK